MLHLSSSGNSALRSSLLLQHRPLRTPLLVVHAASKKGFGSAKPKKVSVFEQGVGWQCVLGVSKQLVSSWRASTTTTHLWTCATICMVNWSHHLSLILLLTSPTPLTHSHTPAKQDAGSSGTKKGGSGRQRGVAVQPPQQQQPGGRPQVPAGLENSLQQFDDLEAAKRCVLVCVCERECWCVVLSVSLLCVSGGSRVGARMG